MIDKLKKKCYNVQKDFEAMQVKYKFLEKESYELGEKVKE